MFIRKKSLNKLLQLYNSTTIQEDNIDLNVLTWKSIQGFLKCIDTCIHENTNRKSPNGHSIVKAFSLSGWGYTSFLFSIWQIYVSQSFF